MVLFARTTPLEEVEKRSRGLSVFLVDCAKPWVTASPSNNAG
jgi:hypothetical protein